MFKKEHVELVYNERLQICKGCRLYDESGEGCALPGTQPCCNQTLFEKIGETDTYGCGCSLSLKLRSLSSACPLNKWPAIMSKRDEELLNKQLDDKG